MQNKECITLEMQCNKVKPKTTEKKKKKTKPFKVNSPNSKLQFSCLENLSC